MKPKVHNKDIIVHDQQPTGESARGGFQTPRSRVPRYDSDNMSAASSMTSVRTIDVTGDSFSSRPQPAPRRKDGAVKGMYPSSSTQSFQSSAQQPQPRPRERNRLSDSDHQSSNQFSSKPTFHQRRNPFTTGRQNQQDYNIDESDDAGEMHRELSYPYKERDDDYYDSDQTLPIEHPSPRSRPSYHGRNALLDVDPRVIQHAVTRQESFEQNDDRRYGEANHSEYDRSPRQLVAEYDTYAHSRPKKGRVEVVATRENFDEEEEAGEWC
ncbi:uncharacterized protein [Watersipora subatra]|uniref:uncharacterized protein n=1 Tax=Watersipora subatra TaxID=2589382 RepID=UPI00355BD10C